jgi:hypothetical protein
MIKKIMLSCLALVFLTTACLNMGNPQPTPTLEGLPPPLPTPSVDYQVVGSTKSSFLVVVDPESSTDRQGIQTLSDYLCADLYICMIWFWDDINKASTTYPVDASHQQTCIAFFKREMGTAQSKLLVYTLGDK